MRVTASGSIHTSAFAWDNYTPAGRDHDFAPNLEPNWPVDVDMRVVKALERDAGDSDQPFQVGADPGHLPRDRRAQIGFTQAHEFG